MRTVAAAVASFLVAATVVPSPAVAASLEEELRFAERPQGEHIETFCHLAYSSRPGRKDCRDESESAVAATRRFLRLVVSYEGDKRQAAETYFLPCMTDSKWRGLTDWREAIECVRVRIARLKEAKARQ